MSPNDGVVHTTVTSPCGTLLDVRSKTPVDNFDPARLRALRLRANLTVIDLAARADMPRTNIHGYEAGTRSVGLHAIVSLADALDVEPLALTTADPAAPTLADLRLRARRSRVELATEAGISYDIWYAVEIGRRRLTDDVAERVARVLGVGPDDVRAAHDRTRATERQLRIGHPTTTARHFALRHRLPAAIAQQPATDTWARHRTAHFAVAAGLDPAAIHLTTTAEAFSAATGIPVGPHDHGMASWADGPVLYVDPLKAATRGDLERLIAHELGHLRWPSLGHRQRFFERVQHLLDTVHP